MKRQRESNSSVASSSRSVKRAKSVQACTNCKKHKTRCEILDGLDQKVIRCHRCKVLEVDCSYQDMDRSIFDSHLPAKEPESHIGTKESRQEKELEIHAGYTGKPTPANAPGSSNASLPTDMYPNRPHQIWDFIHDPQESLDWSAPLQAMGELMKQTLGSSGAPHHPTPTVFNDSLNNILSSDQILQLTSIFERNYSPWLNYNPIREAHSPLLDLVQCTIASRHLDGATRSLVAPRLQALTADSVAKMIFQPRRSETLEAIQCLLILSLWAPVCGVEEDDRDGRLLVASAVSMAHNMRLNEAPQEATRLRKRRAEGDPVSDQDLLDAMNKTRLWIFLTNVESLICLGSGRNPLSKRTATYLTLFPLSSNLPADSASGRDLRLRLLAELFDIVEAGCAIRLQSLSEADVNSWYEGFSHVLTNLGRVTRIILPLSVVSDFDEFYFQSLNIFVRTCRALVLYQASSSVRQYYFRSGTDDPFWFKHIRPHGINILIQWGKETMSVAESILVVFLELDVQLLGTAPDYTFNMIAFAATYIIGCRVLVIRSFGIDIPGSGDKLITKSIEKLNACAYSPDSAPRKTAILISSMQARWESNLASFHQNQRKQGSSPSNNPFALMGVIPADRSVHSSSPASDVSQLSSMYTPPSISPANISPVPQPSHEIPFLPMFGQENVETAGGGNSNRFDFGLFADVAFWNDLFGDSTVYPNTSYVGVQ
ncbi:hypothetical protein GYMLUDRAFT_49479 [Collybiopsis luxurians FD-317 M1]|uniref:Zn(2)-C6 fungal-type domain-containing protein n=1 Tax=Collybiopsis luxurians FD-317 M1 TaxID=944289 RepID=A0A0D0BF59_9AGAR|nr:hypothetical protein GYMLUDRAFT_49479 [Collybiopsis luxurians FD-317 M1]